MTSRIRLSIDGLFDVGRVDDLVYSAHRLGSHYKEVSKVRALVIFRKWYEMYLAS
jgi:hypothetical protein